MGTIKEGNTDRARRLKPEFDKLNYEDKLKLMTKQFGEYWPSGIKDESGNIIISAYPDLNSKEEIQLYNERIINLNEANKNDLFIDLSFDRLKQKYDNEILKIKNSNPDKTCQRNLIKEHIQGQLEIYSKRMSDCTIKRTKDYYKGNWDLSKKVIDNSFLQARAGENYIGFLQSKINKSPKEETPLNHLTFESLFFQPQMAIEVNRILKENDYLNDSGQWISSGKKKRIALPYYVLKDEVNEFGVIRSGTESKQLIIWCKEFGINTSYDKGAELSLKNLLNRPEYNKENQKDYIEFLSLFKPLKKIK